MVEIEVANRSGAELDTAAASGLIRAVLHAEGIDDGELGFQLVAPEEIRALKREHLGIDEATDALAFPIDGLGELPDGMPRQLGDVVVCPEVVGEAWRRPLVHALLHLVGHDHGPEMEAREAVYSG
jgi:probable rRNA maturation factor